MPRLELAWPASVWSNGYDVFAYLSLTRETSILFR